MKAALARLALATGLAISSSALAQSPATFDYTGSLQTFTVPAGVISVTIDARGAQGGSVTTTCAATGGLGARMVGDVAVTPGETLSILVGQQGLTNGSDAGGGGGTYVVRAGNVPLVVAGGGGGATNNITSCGANRNGLDATITTSGTASGNGLVAGGVNGNGGGASTGSGGGGGGFLTDGVAGTGLAGNNGKAYVNGGAGGTGNDNDFGGYGGGGAGWFTGGNGGGGGGYSGGGTSGSQPFTGGGGGGSYNAGTNQVNTAGFQTGNGQVIISWVVVLAPPTAAKTFAPAFIRSGESSVLTVTLTNPNATPLTGAAFTDTYPSGLVNAATPGLTNTCGGTATATALGGSLTLSGGTIPANGSCAVSVSVTSFASATAVNTIGAGGVTTNETAPSQAAASGTLTVSGAEAVPTLGDWGLATLALLIAFGAWRRLHLA